MLRRERDGDLLAARVPVLVGLAGGLLSGIVGGGGGAVMVPMMTGLMRMPQHTAHGTSLVIIAFTALAAAIAYTVTNTLDWVLILILLAGSNAGVYFGARASHRISPADLRQIFALFLIFVAIRLLLFRVSDPLVAADGVAYVLTGAVIGLCGGVASGALGVGGGAIFVPAMVLLLGVDQHEAQGISLWVIVVSASVGALTHRRLGSVDGRAAAWIVPAAIPAGVAGALIAEQLNTNQLQNVFSALLIVLGTQIIWSARRQRRTTRPGT
jgi:uncharacterized membrane protein YfcA